MKIDIMWKILKRADWKLLFTIIRYVAAFIAGLITGDSSEFFVL